MKKVLSIFSILALFLVLAITGCQQQPTSPPNITNPGAIISTGNMTTYVNATTSLPNTTQSNEYGNVSYTITGTEGDLITLKPNAYSPDGAKITYYYTDPFNDNGLWQTRDGDAGKYLVKITAFDGILNSSADVLVVIKPSNKAPVIDCPEKINVKEGETVDLGCTFFDKENDPLVIEYSGWMNSASYTTNFESAGDHKVQASVSDGFHNVTKTIIIHVENVDRAPIFNEHLKDMTATEGDIVVLKTNVTDPDKGDTITLTYSEPFNSQGQWKTIIGDAGTYPITVVASDGTLSTKETFTLRIQYLNTPPTMRTIKNITVNEGDLVSIVPEVKDREGDPITIRYTGWMNSSSRQTTYDDAYPNGCDTRGCTAIYKTTVTASDGQYNVSQDVFVLVNDKNRPPVFVWPGG